MKTNLLILGMLLLFGCTTVATPPADTIYANLSGDSDSIAMNYHSDPATTRDAVVTELRSIGQTPVAASPATGDTIPINSESFMIAAGPLERGSGTRLEIAVRAGDRDQLQRSRDLLNAVARRLDEYQEVVRSYNAGLDQARTATFAQLEAMGYAPGQRDIVSDSDSTYIRVGDFWIELEALPQPGVVRIHIGGSLDVDRHVQLALEFLDGVGKRLNDAIDAIKLADNRCLCVAT